MVLQRNPRTVGILAVAKANKIDLDVVTVDTANPPAEYLAYNKLGKVPTFVGSDGYVLSECIAIAIYSRSTPGNRAPPIRLAQPCLHDEKTKYSYPCLNLCVDLCFNF